MLGRGRTGSGKTYAFLLPLVARLQASRRTPRKGAPRALVLAPTRELVGQIEAALQPLAKAAGLTTLVIYGGVGQGPQVRGLQRGVDIVLACPGRLEDLMGQRHCSLGDIEVTVLDEADHMADLGFLPSVRRILAATPATGQRLLFSATLDAAIDTLVKRFLTNPVTHQADSAQSPISAMEHHVLHVDRAQRVPVLVDLASAPGRTMVFTRTKRGAKVLTRQLNQSGVPAVEMHGNLSQGARTRNLESFHAGRATTMVATDIAARGIHVDDVTLVVHADPPAEHKAYLHRSGRTARAGAAGTVVTLMTSDQVRDVRALSRAAGISPRTTVDRRRRAPGPRRARPGRAHHRPRRARRLRRRRAVPARRVAVAQAAAAAGPARVARAAPAAAEQAVKALPAVALRRPAGPRDGAKAGAAGSGKGGGAKSGGGQRRRGGNGGGSAAGARRTGGHSAASFSSRAR